MDASQLEVPIAQRAARSLVIATLVFRWIWLVWMSVLAALTPGDLVRPGLAWASIAAAAIWTVRLSVTRSRLTPTAIWLDVALSTWLILASGLVVAPGEVIADRPFFATGYPMSSALLVGALRGPWGGIAVATVLAAAHLATRPLNDVALGRLAPEQIQNVTGAMLNYLVAGFAVGLVARWFDRSAREVRDATNELVTERERSARLQERESLARQIHDSVLQALAMVNKRGTELARREQIAPEDVAKLARIAGRQEQELRALISRAPQDAPTGTASLREVLEKVARGLEEPRASITAVGPVWVARATAEEVAAAVRQALDNVVEHAHATRVSVFAEEQPPWAVVSVRDDGRGFDYDEHRLAAEGKLGILKSIRGRVEDLGGSARIRTEPGAGTEIELRVPLDPGGR